MFDALEAQNKTTGEAIAKKVRKLSNIHVQMVFFGKAKLYIYKIVSIGML